MNEVRTETIQVPAEMLSPDPGPSRKSVRRMERASEHAIGWIVIIALGFAVLVAIVGYHRSSDAQSKLSEMNDRFAVLDIHAQQAKAAADAAKQAAAQAAKDVTTANELARRADDQSKLAEGWAIKAVGAVKTQNALIQNIDARENTNRNKIDTIERTLSAVQERQLSAK